MPKLELALEKDAPKDLRIEWSAGFKKASVTYREQPLLEVPSKKALLEGASATLPDGSTLSLRLQSPFLLPTLEVLRNGAPVRGSQTHPEGRIKTASTLLYVIAALTLFSALATAATADVAVLVGIVVEAILFAAFAFFTRQQKRWALYGGTGLYAFESLFVFVGLVSGGNVAAAVGGTVGFFLWRAFFFTILGRGIKAFGHLDRFDTNEAVAVFR